MGRFFHAYMWAKKCVAFWQNSHGLGPKKTTPETFVVKCEWCKKTFTRKWLHYQREQIRKKLHPFCSRICKWRWKEKSGILPPVNMRSGLEIWVENKIKQMFPSLVMLCNNRTLIDGELDFYFPTLRLGIEINGKYHYEPIYGSQSLSKRILKDISKREECQQKGIELITVDARNYSCNLKNRNEDQYWKEIEKKLIERTANIALCNS